MTYEERAAAEADFAEWQDRVFGDFAAMQRDYYDALLKPELPFPDAAGATAPAEGEGNEWGDPLADR